MGASSIDFGSVIGGHGGSGNTPRDRSKAVLFLLAHQFDEVGLAPIISDAKREGRRVAIVYLTSGDASGVGSRTADASALRLLDELGVQINGEVTFLGQQLAVSRGLLCRNMVVVHAALRAKAEALLPIDHIYVHAWEGGSVDYDSTHALAVGLAASLGLQRAVLQVPYLRDSGKVLLPTAVLSPIASNGPVAFYKLSLQERFRWLSLALRYRRGPTIGLGGWLLLFVSTMMSSGVPIQYASLSRLNERPTHRPLRYERLGCGDYMEVRVLISDFLKSIGEHDPPC